MSDDYPNLWKRGLIQVNVRNRANHQCEQCEIKFHEGTNIAIDACNSVGKAIIGTVHHIDMNKQNCSINNLVYLCQTCHTRVHGLGFVTGATLPRVWIYEIPKWITSRNIPYQPHPQLPLFEEVQQ